MSSPNITGLEVMLWTCDQVMLGSNLSFPMAILTEPFCDFPQSNQTNAEILSQTGHDHFLLHPFHPII
jgi:hypothetical protein